MAQQEEVLSKSEQLRAWAQKMSFKKTTVLVAAGQTLIYEDGEITDSVPHEGGCCLHETVRRGQVVVFDDSFHDDGMSAIMDKIAQTNARISPELRKIGKRLDDALADFAQHVEPLPSMDSMLRKIALPRQHPGFGRPDAPKKPRAKSPKALSAREDQKAKAKIKNRRKSKRGRQARRKQRD